MSSFWFQALLASCFFAFESKQRRNHQSSQCVSRDSGHGTGDESQSFWDDYDERKPLLFSVHDNSFKSLQPADNLEGSSRHYTKEKVDFYMRLNQDDDDDDEEVSRVSDVRKTLGITASGACEV